jgi:branched-chain amino acid transport system ATP-binding protein
MREASALSASGLTMRFGGIVAVNNVTLSVPIGARYALIGPNGAGKTSLINLLTGALSPTDGAVKIAGNDVTRLDTQSRVRLGLSRTFQINSLFSKLTPFESLCIAIAEREEKAGIWWKRLVDMGEIRDEANALLEQMNLSDQARVCTDELAYGKQRLLEIALALATKPRVLLLDEPAAGIPSGEGRDVFEVIEALPEKMSVVFIEHDMDLVFQFARHIIVLSSGEILAAGTPDEIRSDQRVRTAYLGTRHV